jgi:hypothetical protein
MLGILKGNFHTNSSLAEREKKRKIKISGVEREELERN